MHKAVYRAMLVISIAAIVLVVPCVASAQEDAEAVAPDATAGPDTLDEATPGRVYAPEYFARFAPRNALDMLNRVPGFAVRSGDQGRGLGQANTNVLINGQRLSSKSQDVFDQLRRVATENVDRIEIVDGATLEIPGLSGQVANVITRGGDISGRYEYRTMHRPKYAEPSWFGGELSVSSSTANLEWNAAYTHGSGRGAAAGPATITDELGNVTEWRDVLLHFEGEFPRLSGSLKWNGAGGTVANLNAQYSRNYSDFSNDEERDLLAGIDQFRDFENRGRGSGYEIGADVDFELGSGRLKLIGLDRSNDNDSRSDSTLIFVDDTPTTGNRFASQSESGERIGRAEYRWDTLGGNWEVDVEAAFNRLDQASQLFRLEDAGDLVEVPLPNSSGQVTEDRYEIALTHGRTLAEGLTMQLGIGGEKSELTQTGPSGLSRKFWRPKGSFSLAWTPREGLDVSLNIARRVGQLSFDQFLANVDLVLGNANAGNAELKPALRWESNLQIKQNLGDWGSSTLQLYSNRYDDYIDIIPLPGGGESPGNIDSAQLYGLDWRSTINLDAVGWEGVRLDLNFTFEESSIKDPLTGIDRAFSNQFDREAEISLRHDIAGSDWAWGVGIQYDHVLPAYRLSQVERNYEGPTYTWAFVERKNVLGLTLNLQIFNLTDGRAIYRRTVWAGRRDNSSVLFNEHRDLSVQPIFRFQITGSF